ncbi:MAG TPA: hypothetical protein VG733_01635 [Chthoniobacteraceae bacterium]|nr:hypothetical protein [Chthoniobacteraceae bacterium]
MKLASLLFCFVLLLPNLSFADTEDITLNDGTELKNAIVTRVEKDGMMIQTDDGVQKYPMNLIPKEVQLVHPYIPPATPTPLPTPAPPTPVETPKPVPSASVAPSAENTGAASGHSVSMTDSCAPFIRATVAGIIIALVSLVAAWFILARLIAAWGRRERQQEIDSANALQFNTAYTDFFAIWKLWSHYLDHGENELPDHGEYEIPHASRWELLTRTYIAEGTIDALFLKLASARKLSPATVEMLGRFRQGFHTLGVAIKTNKPMPWKDPEHPDYLVFKRLASSVAALIAGENLGTQAADVRADAFRQITSGRWERSWSSESAH